MFTWPFLSGYMWKKERVLVFSPLLIRALALLDDRPTLMISFNCNLKALSAFKLHQVTFEVRASTYEFGGGMQFSPKHLATCLTIESCRSENL